MGGFYDNVVGGAGVGYLIGGRRLQATDAATFTLSGLGAIDVDCVQLRARLEVSNIQALSLRPNGLTTDLYRQRSSNAAAASAAADGVITSSSGGTPDSIFLDMLIWFLSDNVQFNGRAKLAAPDATTKTSMWFYAVNWAGAGTLSSLDIAIASGNIKAGSWVELRRASN